MTLGKEVFFLQSTIPQGKIQSEVYGDRPASNRETPAPDLSQGLVIRGSAAVRTMLEGLG